MVKGMPHLDVLKTLERRRRKRVEIHKSQQDNIQYHAAIRRQVDRENLRAERTRLQGLLSKAGPATQQMIHDRYDELTKAPG